MISDIILSEECDLVIESANANNEDRLHHVLRNYINRNRLKCNILPRYFTVNPWNIPNYSIDLNSHWFDDEIRAIENETLPFSKTLHFSFNGMSSEWINTLIESSLSKNSIYVVINAIWIMLTYFTQRIVWFNMGMWHTGEWFDQWIKKMISIWAESLTNSKLNKVLLTSYVSDCEDKRWVRFVKSPWWSDYIGWKYWAWFSWINPATANQLSRSFRELGWNYKCIKRWKEIISDWAFEEIFFYFYR